MWSPAGIWESKPNDSRINRDTGRREAESQSGRCLQYRQSRKHRRRDFSRRAEERARHHPACADKTGDPLDVIGPCMTAAAALAAVSMCSSGSWRRSRLPETRSRARLHVSDVRQEATSVMKRTSPIRRPVWKWPAVTAQIEAELGKSCVGCRFRFRKRREKLYTRPDEARDFVQRTGIDALAAAWDRSRHL